MTENTSRIALLASIIQTCTQKIDTYLKENGHPSPSFDVKASPDLLLPLDLVGVQQQVLEACTELQALLEGPRAHLTHITSPRVNILMSLQAINHFNIPASLTIGEEVTFEELARRCFVDQTQLKRLLRMAISYNIFSEPRKGVVAHTAISKLVAEERLAHQWIGLVCNEMIPSSVQAIPAMSRWPGSGEPHETGYALAHGDTVWNILQKDVVRARRFADGMQYLQSHPSFNLEFLADALAWNTNGAPNTFVDIGGSRGYISIALAQRYPGLKCYVQDTPEALQGALAPKRLEDRVQFSVHNFLTPQTIKDADVYFMRSILHDWSDKYALKIIRNLIPALKIGAKVIVNEVCLPEPNTIPAYHDQLLRGYDLAMFQQFNSQERDAADWKALFQTADDRFKLARVVTLPGSILSVVEFVWGAENM